MGIEVQTDGQFDSEIQEIKRKKIGEIVLNDMFLRTSNPNLFFIYTPKIACTYVKSAILKDLYGDIEHLNCSLYLDAPSRQSMIHSLAFNVLRADGTSALSNPNRIIVGFCRNPYSRLISTYKNKILYPIHSEKSHWKYVRREIMFDTLRHQTEKKILNEFNSGVSFDHFVDFLHRKSFEIIDLHWAGQLEINNYEIISGIKMIRFESFAGDFSRIWENYLEKPLCINQSKALNSTNNIEIPGSISQETFEKIYHIYRADFKAFGYSKDSWHDCL